MLRRYIELGSPDMQLPQIRIVLFAGCLLAGLTGAACAQDSTAATESSRPAAGEADITRWVTDLASSSYQVRERATQRLIKADGAAIAPVAEAASDYRLEVRRRAVSIMRAIYERSPDLDASNLAYDALNSLADSEHATVAQEASRVLRSNIFLEQRRAIKAIRAMNGQVHLEYDLAVQVDGVPYLPPRGWARMVAIGENWTGGDDGLREVFKLRDTVMTVYLVRGHPLTPEAVVKLETELTNVPPGGIQQRGDAFLGVSLESRDTVGVGTMLKDVTPGNAAEKYGLLSKDAVVEIAGEPVRSAEDLVSIVGNHRPGEKLRFVVLRGESRDRLILHDLLTGPGGFSPLLSIGLISNMRTEIDVTLGRWSIDN